jgi:hypothetical protein
VRRVMPTVQRVIRATIAMTRSALSVTRRNGKRGVRAKERVVVGAVAVVRGIYTSLSDGERAGASMSVECFSANVIPMNPRAGVRTARVRERSTLAGTKNRLAVGRVAVRYSGLRGMINFTQTDRMSACITFSIADDRYELNNVMPLTGMVCAHYVSPAASRTPRPVWIQKSPRPRIR